MAEAIAITTRHQVAGIHIFAMQRPRALTSGDLHMSTWIKRAPDTATDVRCALSSTQAATPRTRRIGTRPIMSQHFTTRFAQPMFRPIRSTCALADKCHEMLKTFTAASQGIMISRCAYQSFVAAATHRRGCLPPTDVHHPLASGAYPNRHDY